MHKRRIDSTINLDLSLRSARNFYFVAALFFLPGALFSVLWIIAGIDQLVAFFSAEPGIEPESAIWDILIGAILLGIEYFTISQALEARRRIRRLADDPAAPVRPLYVPSFFQSL